LLPADVYELQELWRVIYWRFGQTISFIIGVYLFFDGGFVFFEIPNQEPTQYFVEIEILVIVDSVLWFCFIVRKLYSFQICQKNFSCNWLLGWFRNSAVDEDLKDKVEFRDLASNVY
jgi:hypothetical protein